MPRKQLTSKKGGIIGILPSFVCFLLMFENLVYSIEYTCILYRSPDNRDYRHGWGFGSSVFFVPVAQFFLSIHAVLALTGVMHIFSNTAKLVYFYRHINWRMALLLGVPGGVAVFIGAYYSASIDPQWLQLGLGVFISVLSLVLLLLPTQRMQATTTNAVTGGSVAGFLAGVMGTGGAIRGLTLAAFDLEKHVFVATSAAIDFGIDAIRTAVYLKHGFFPIEYAYYVPLLLGVAFGGSYIGRKLLNYIPQSVFRVLVPVLLLWVGLVLIGRHFYKA